MGWLKDKFQGASSKIKGAFRKKTDLNPIDLSKEKGLFKKIGGAFKNVGNAIKSGEGVKGKVKGFFSSYGKGMKSVMSETQGIAKKLGGLIGIDVDNILGADDDKSGDSDDKNKLNIVKIIGGVLLAVGSIFGIVKLIKVFKKNGKVKSGL